MLREYYFPLSKHLLEKMQVTASYVYSTLICIQGVHITITMQCLRPPDIFTHALFGSLV